ncbi:glycosyltransferase family 2 protein [Amycolatopsis thermophila]|uniref:Hyaluronan synthase n=1 Tax=Amycolatopsis thermophila TaxID=206084 RepID=A0ABU0F5I8_9PSEU|nr:glycosyltransferase [Amycolatopsis thermophila]MDQ0382643.1 hyaluronan synthase [Amycolatopsis thermophila]
MSTASKSGRFWPLLACVVSVLAATAWTTYYHFVWGHSEPTSVTFWFYTVATAIMIYYLGAAVIGRKFTHLPVAKGWVVAIVPTYNEEAELLRRTVMALVQQTRPPDEIHVVDDGSAVPVEPFHHPLVTWHRQTNQGKRHAQANVLNKLDRRKVDYIVTVDSDSVLDKHALAHVLRAMSNDRIQAATGLTLVENRHRNLLTRIVDLEMVTWCMVTRVARSILGAVAPTSGILAIYRADLVYDNLEDYVTSGTAGDDRRLTHYALLRGQVVAVNEALVHSALPEHLGQMWRQRVRWFKSYWRYVGWEIEHFPLIPLLFRAYGMIFTLVSPLVYAWVLILLPGQSKLVLIQGFGYWVIMTWAQTAMYAAMRPEMKLGTRLTAWIFLTPLVSLVNLLLIRPAMYWAIFKAKDQSWMTRTPEDLATAIEDEPTRQLAPVVSTKLPTRIVAAVELATEETRILPAVGYLPKHPLVEAKS